MIDAAALAGWETVAYRLHGNCYLNLTQRCTLRCRFCPKFNGTWRVKDFDLRLHREPSVEQLLAAVGDPREYREVVFCGLGEPTLRLPTVLAVAERLRADGARVRLNTDGLASLTHGYDVTPELAGRIDALSVSLNAQNSEIYNRHCRPKLPGAYAAMLDFVRRARRFVPDITVTAIDGLAGVDIAACAEIADRLGVNFRRRVLDNVG
ncbi:MAG: radical SAM protein [Candidatus Muproteobacteria bacterium RBG_16_64_11]|uniref:Radical SAM protein n=1 Tax=Candidatus Muproteobacteria bacterium RBG_16_64_11 TaxID=1817758 RepID=A0A1F6TEF8_9PROT|nr:MAG: radical SAM protein [Candidatus Muproteobacteria bacterium RBG_16_64_11]